ncbi:hypothetical protein KUL156_16690 [Alteromonas sp. KUL156]|nr:hypothetical protein KUL106_06400 [Alteromonas sp. KUL106]GFD92582.1 hypothetical protein KUL154_13150 [Alteromonas sp. KUL154]GFD99076.1 hypothetical protein KUL156_16690 [Alteromonas sp. KUL156]
MWGYSYPCHLSVQWIFIAIVESKSKNINSAYKALGAADYLKYCNLFVLYRNNPKSDRVMSTIRNEETFRRLEVKTGIYNLF